MRVLHLLVGLAGLAGVSLASPTPVDARRNGVALDSSIQAIGGVIAADPAFTMRGDNTGLSPAGGPGETKLCYTDERCVTLSANDNCVFIPGEVNHMVRKIYQEAGSICKYFDRNCNSEPVVKVNSHSGFKYLELEGWVGNQIGYVKCQSQWDAGADDKSGQLQARDLTPGNVRGCNPDNNCQYVQPALHCKEFPPGIAKNLASILQWKYSICKYYGSTDCSNSLLTTAVAGREDYSVDMSWKIGERIASVYCEVSQGADAADDGRTIYHMAAQSSSLAIDPPLKSTIEADTLITSLVARKELGEPVDDPRTASNGPLKLCHDINLGGKCFYYSGAPACANNPFNVDAIESFSLEQDWRCAFYSINDCSPANGPPHYVDSKNGPLVVNDVDYWISSMTCIRSPFHDAPIDATPSLQSRNDSTPVLPDAILNPQSEYYLLLFHDVNFGGKVIGYTGGACANNPFNVDAIESLYLEKGWRCAFYPVNDCQPTNGPPHYVDSKNGDIGIADVDYWISSITCMPSPSPLGQLLLTHDIQARNERPATTYDNPGDATICDFYEFAACGTVANALNACQPVYSEYGAPASLIQYKGAVCKWYESVACLRDEVETKFRLVDSRNGTVWIGDTGEEARMKSVECKADMW